VSTADLVHLELHTADIASAVELGQVLFGWRPRPVPAARSTYLALDVGCSAGLVECGSPSPVWVPYIEVDDVACSLRRARDLGAEQLLGPRTGPDGRRAVLRGALGDLALWERS
jgi:predicted enzyme related to lactoylglutathione lyase